MGPSILLCLQSKSSCNAVSYFTSQAGQVCRPMKIGTVSFFLLFIVLDAVRQGGEYPQLLFKSCRTVFVLASLPPRDWCLCQLWTQRAPSRTVLSVICVCTPMPCPCSWTMHTQQHERTEVSSYSGEGCRVTL